MSREDDWQLPEDYWAERRANGRTTLWLDEICVREFGAEIPQKAVEAWADAYATGRRAGEALGRLVGRRQLAAEFRSLIEA